jgi:cyclopropane fatty-acyl-phospholipid synthase-like methyltransferase
MSAGRKGHYGLDAPYLLVLPVIVIVFDVWQAAVTRRPWPLIGGALVVFFCGFGWHSSRRGKFVVWRQILDDLKMRGDEQILDVGCGRGAVLLMAASRLTTGHATGIDLWRRQDQSGNAMEATRKNADAEGVAGRVSLETADMTALPFAPGSFDLIVSSLAIHNVPGQEKRDRAIEEIIRVLRPGGRVAIADLRHIARYRERLEALGMADVSVRDLGWKMWWGGPWVPTKLVTARRQ